MSAARGACTAGTASPQGAPDAASRWIAETAKWVEEQNKVTYAYLSQIPYRAKIKERLEQLYNYPKIGAPFRRGELYFFYLQRLNEAEHEGQEAVRLDPKCIDGHKLLARLYVYTVKAEQKSSQVNPAIQSYEEVAKLDPANAEAWAFLADLYETKKDTARQIQALERSQPVLPML